MGTKPHTKSRPNQLAVYRPGRRQACAESRPVAPRSQHFWPRRSLPHERAVCPHVLRLPFLRRSEYQPCQAAGTRSSQLLFGPHRSAIGPVGRELLLTHHLRVWGPRLHRREIGGDFDFSGGLAFHGMKTQDVLKQGVALNFHDAKVAGDIRLGDKFRAIGQVRLIAATIGRSLTCGGGKFKGGGQTAIDARPAQMAAMWFSQPDSWPMAASNCGGKARRRPRLQRRPIYCLEFRRLSADLIDVGGPSFVRRRDSMPKARSG